jgi:hypothetical protein
MQKIALPTKASEIEFLSSLVERLPEASYLHDALKPFVEQFASLVKSDLPPSVIDSIRDRIEFEKEAAAVRKEIETLKAEKKRLRKEFFEEASRLKYVVESIGRAETLVKVAKRGCDEALDAAKTLFEEVSK